MCYYMVYITVYIYVIYILLYIYTSLYVYFGAGNNIKYYVVCVA